MPSWFNGLNALILAVAVTTASSTFADQDDPWEVSRGDAPMSLSNAASHNAHPISAGAFDDASTAEADYSDETSTASSEPILWEGFLYGDQHFRDKPRPVGSPLYFEDPFINSDLRPIYL